MRPAVPRCYLHAAALIAGFGLAAGLAAGPAEAENKIVNLPAEKFLIAPGGVDMRTGRYVYSQTDLSIGSGEGALALIRSLPEHAGGHANPFRSFSHNWDIYLLERPGSGNADYSYRMTVHVGGRALTFETPYQGTGYGYKSDGPRATLSFTGAMTSDSAVYTFTSPEGAVATFRPMGSKDCASGERCAYVSELIEPDGTRYSFDYAYNAGAEWNRARLTRVTSSRGYALLLEGGGSEVTKACVLNLAVAPAPANGLCPANAPATASYTYATLGLASATNPAGEVSSFTYSSDGQGYASMGFIKPGGTAPWLTNTLFWRPDEEDTEQELVRSQAFADGQTYTYDYTMAPVTDTRPYPTVAGGTYADAANHTTYVPFDFPIKPGTGPTTPCTQTPCTLRQPNDFLDSTFQQTPGPIWIEDALGRRTTFDYCDPAVMAGAPPTQLERCAVKPLVSFTDPEGVKTELFYDTVGNVTKAVRHPKSGSAPNIVTQAAYDTANPKSQTKPLWTIDANWGVTSYIYAQAHGGVLAETDPAVNGVTPQKRYTYQQRYAWISNGAGGYAHAASPVWLLTEMRSCKTSNPASGGGCAAGASDEMVTTYDYGPDAGPNNLLLRGTVVDAGGLALRTCYGYDAMGNKVSETSPRGTSGPCS
jgi:hypothetical protein